MTDYDTFEQADTMSVDRPRMNEILDIYNRMMMSHINDEAVPFAEIQALGQHLCIIFDENNDE